MGLSDTHRQAGGDKPSSDMIMLISDLHFHAFLYARCEMDFDRWSDVAKIQQTESIWDQLNALKPETRIEVMAPVIGYYSENPAALQAAASDYRRLDAMVMRDERIDPYYSMRHNM